LHITWTRPIGTLIHISHRRVWRWRRWRLLVNDKDLCSLISRKKSVKTPILAFKVIQGHWIQRQSKAGIRFPIGD